MKNLKPLLSLIFILPIFLSSCIKVDTKEYTAESEQIDLSNYIANLTNKGYNVDTTALGVYYIRLKDGTGDFPFAGDTLSIKYAGYLIDGTVFETSFYNSPDSAWTYVYKTQNILPAWDEITGKMNKGCKMQFIIPSSLAYGPTGAGSIPPYSPLIFVAIMDNIRKKN
jgi:FKBP-type peptidyl-prolyl cis-trans isomerase FkpA